MMTIVGWTLVLGLLLIGPVYADQTSDREEIVRVIDDSIGWFKTKNFDRLFEVFPNDPNLFLFSPNSSDTTIGGEAFRQSSALWKDPNNSYLRHEIRDLRINLSQSGTVAWWSAILDDCGSYGGREVCWKDTRWTGVVENRNGKWVIAQCHFSFGADKVAEAVRAAENAQPESFTDYPSMRKRVGELFNQKKYAAAAAILETALDQFPDHLMANVFNLSLMALLQHDLKTAVYWLEEGHRRGVFFNRWAFLADMWKPLGDHPRFKAFLEENTRRIDRASARAQMKLELVKPKYHRPEKASPLFIALHGGGESIETFKPQWTSTKLAEEYIVAYVQSTQVADMNGFHWQDDAITKRDLTQAYRETTSQVSIDPKRVVIGGFSSGGYGSMVALFNDLFPVRGFVILCPELPADPSPDVLTRLKKSEIKGTLLTTELDQRIERQKAFVDRFNEAEVPVRLVVTPNIGHWYPKNLGDLIDQALKDIR